MQVRNGELRAPYSVGGRGLTAHYFSCRTDGGILHGRFEWLYEDLLGDDISGYIALRITSHDLLTGGWCYTRDLPHLLRDGQSELKPEHSGLQPLILHRTSDTTFPEWAQDYFRRYEI